MLRIELIQHYGTDQTVCDSARVSTLNHKKESTPEKDKRLLRFLWKHGHTSPFEHIGATFLIDAPIFITRQVMRHRTFSYNEISRRYTEKDIEFYHPGKLFQQSSVNLQTSTEIPVEDKGDVLLKTMKQHSLEALDLYNHLLSQGVSREQARIILPQNLMTSFYMSGNLNNWLKFIKLRVNKDVQHELIYIADIILGKLKTLYPLSTDLFYINNHTQFEDAPNRIKGFIQ